MRKTTQALWQKGPSGVLVPVGAVTEGKERFTRNFLHVKEMAEIVETQFLTHGVPIPQSSTLRAMLDKTKSLAIDWLANQLEGHSERDVFDVLHVMRIAEACKALGNIANGTDYLRRLTSGELAFFNRTRSPAKDAFWELELCALLQRRSPQTRLMDPPDIIVDLPAGKIGIACKKVYSEANLEKVLSQAVKQVESYFDIAVVAFNIDDLVPADVVLKKDTEQEMAATLRAIADAFIHRHQRRIKKYLASTRLVGVITAVHMIVDVQEWSARLNNARQSTVWCFPGIDARAKFRVAELQSMLMG